MDSMRPVNTDPRRLIPSVHRLVAGVRAADSAIPAWAATEGARQIVEEAREAGGDGHTSLPASDEEWVDHARGRALALWAPRPRRVVNATGVVLHTNLGRAPMAPGAAAAAAQAAAGYSDLELDLATGRRGDRLAGIEEKLRLLAGAEAAYACNNCAAAVLLALNTLAAGREVIVSRGELVEIGGSFRVPEIMRRAGVELVEVGATNRTHPRDYVEAIGPRTAMLLKVHRSNFELRGFVAEVGLGELVRIGAEHGVPVVEDLGSGTLVDLSARGLPPDAYAPSRLREGPDLVCFSGDKLMGGPQAGIVLGRAPYVEAMRRNPLARALRLDKMTLAALDWTLRVMLDGRAEDELPALRQLLAPPERLEARARALAARLARDGAAPAGALEVRHDRVPVGGGSLPGFELDGWVIALHGGGGAEALADRLRAEPVPVLARVRDDLVLVDLRTVDEEDEEIVARAVRTAFAADARDRD
jgi:L-seryl-tRNA(Ser) seleniumtransferase